MSAQIAFCTASRLEIMYDDATQELDASRNLEAALLTDLNRNDQINLNRSTINDKDHLLQLIYTFEFIFSSR